MSRPSTSTCPARSTSRTRICTRPVVVKPRNSIRPKVGTVVSLQIARFFGDAFSRMLRTLLSVDNGTPSSAARKEIAARSSAPRRDCPGASRISGTSVRRPLTTICSMPLSATAATSVSALVTTFSAALMWPLRALRSRDRGTPSKNWRAPRVALRERSGPIVK